MKSTFWTAAVALLASVAPAAAQSIQRRNMGIKQHHHPNKEVVANMTFDQLLDHKDPKKGTFKQRYWYSTEYWKGPGSPVFLFNVGEQEADGFTGYLHNETITGKYAQEFGGAVIVIEHRYWGKSNPFTNLTAETLQYLDLPQSVWDMTYFAKNVVLPAGKQRVSNADKAPWVLIGGSYPGALAAWTQQIDPGVFWAYHASSAVVEAIYDFYPYFDAVTNAIPLNCSYDMKAVIKHVDDTLTKGDKDEVLKLKKIFGLGVVEHDDDFVQQLAYPFVAWQGNETAVLEVCDAIETYTTSWNPPSNRIHAVGLDAALAGFGAYIAANTGCEKPSDCDSHSTASHASMNNYQDTSGDRQWMWMLCHQPFSWWQIGPLSNEKGDTIISSHLRPDSRTEMCKYTFPDTNGFQVGCSEGFTSEHLNMYTGGWDADFERVLFVNGEVDPWLAATPAAPRRPGGPRKSTDKMPILTVKGGNHVPDFFISSEPEVASVQKESLAIMKKWLAEYKKQ